MSYFEKAYCVVTDKITSVLISINYSKLQRGENSYIVRFSNFFSDSFCGRDVSGYSTDKRLIIEYDLDKKPILEGECTPVHTSIDYTLYITLHYPEGYHYAEAKKDHLVQKLHAAEKGLQLSIIDAYSNQTVPLKFGANYKPSATPIAVTHSLAGDIVLQKNTKYKLKLIFPPEFDQFDFLKIDISMSRGRSVITP